MSLHSDNLLFGISKRPLIDFPQSGNGYGYPILQGGITRQTLRCIFMGQAQAQTQTRTKWRRWCNRYRLHCMQHQWKNLHERRG